MSEAKSQDVGCELALCGFWAMRLVRNLAFFQALHLSDSTTSIGGSRTSSWVVPWMNMLLFRPHACPWHMCSKLRLVNINHAIQQAAAEFSWDQSRSGICLHHQNQILSVYSCSPHFPSRLIVWSSCHWAFGPEPQSEPAAEVGKTPRSRACLGQLRQRRITAARIGSI